MKSLYIQIICLLFLVEAVTTSAYFIAVNQVRDIGEELECVRSDYFRVDSMWRAYHDIPGQVQELLRGNLDSANIYHQIVSESGNFSSSQFIRNRNLFGFHNGRSYLKFDHWKQSFDKFMNEFYCDKRHGESYCAFIRRRKFGSAGVVDYCMK